MTKLDVFVALQAFDLYPRPNVSNDSDLEILHVRREISQ